MMIVRAIIVVISIFVATSVYSNDQGGKPNNDVIIVGVRDDAQPFSYRTLAKGQERILSGYGGYMIEICRRVLDTLVKDIESPFSGYKVVTKSVKASKRWDALKNNQVHMLCGPNSITLDRLGLYNASLPLFMSGISFVSVNDESFPKTRNSCVPILGYLSNTTAQSEGLRKIAEKNLLQLYDQVLDDYLALQPIETVNVPVRKRVENLRIKIADVIAGKPSATLKGGEEVDLQSQASIAVPTCVDGYGDNPGPIVPYEKHEDGIEDICNGKLLFYVADVDIMRYRLENDPNCRGKYRLHHETLTKEAYAVFFKRIRRIDVENSQISGTLFSEFNNELQQKMQRIEGILRYEFDREFVGVDPTNELQQFFTAFQFIKDN